MLAYGVNRYSIRTIGRRAVTLEGPVLEEVLKTLVAVIMGASVFGVHVVFGILEAGYDFASESRDKRTAGRGILAAVLSISGHTAFGLITVYVSQALGFWQAGTVVAILAHAAWNRLFAA